MIALLWVVLATNPALADEHRVVRSGDTLESMAEEHGFEDRLQEVREASGIAPGEQPVVGSILVIPGEAPLKAARVLRVSGRATVTEPGLEPVDAAENMGVAPGGVVCTLGGSYLTIRLASDDECVQHDDLTLLPETCMTVHGRTPRTSS